MTASIKQSFFFIMSIKSFCNELVCELLDFTLPTRTKRVLCISSLCPKVLPIEELDSEYLSLLNTQLNLCRDEDALKLPIAVSNTLWPEIDDIVSESLASQDYDSSSLKILGMIPEWLRYDHADIMLNEIKQFLKFNSVFHKSHKDQIANAH